MNDLFEIKLILYGLSRMLKFSEFVWTPCYSVWDNFLLIHATDRSKMSSDQKRFFIALSQYPLSFFANTPFKLSLKFNFSSSAYAIEARDLLLSWIGDQWEKHRFILKSISSFFPFITTERKNVQFRIK